MTGSNMESPPKSYHNPAYENPNIPQRIQRIQEFSPEEFRVIKECNRESFLYRCLPIGVSMMALTYMGSKSVSKTIAAGFAGYIVGKVSYIGTCRKKMLQIDNEDVRKRWGLRIPGPMTNMTTASDMHVTESPHSGDDYQPNINFESSPLNDGLDDCGRPSIDNDFKNVKDENELRKSFNSYHELRNANREEHYRKNATQAKSATPHDLPVRPIQKKNMHPESANQPSSLGNEKNRYGDVWDK